MSEAGRPTAVPQSLRYIPSLAAWCGRDLASALTALRASAEQPASLEPAGEDRSSPAEASPAQVSADADAPSALEPAAKRRRAGQGAGEGESGESERATARAGHLRPALSLLALWGEARWSRTQLLGEAARGDWGLCLSRPTDLAGYPQAGLWERVLEEQRLAYVPENETTSNRVRSTE